MTFLGQDDKSQQRSGASYLHLKMSRVTFCLASAVTVHVEERVGEGGGGVGWVVVGGGGGGTCAGA